MIKEVIMYAVFCDGCGKQNIDEDMGFCAWTDETSASDNVSENWRWINQKIYCDECCHYDEEKDDYVPNAQESDAGER